MIARKQQATGALANNTADGFMPMLIQVDGAVPVDNGAGTVANRRLTLDDIDAAFAISSFAIGVTSTKELGDTIVNPNFTASYNATITTPLTIGDGTNTDAILLANKLAFAYNAGGVPARTYSKSTINAAVTWTLTAIKAAGPTKTATVQAVWRARRFSGLSVTGTYNEAFIEALASSGLQSGYTGSYAFGAGSAGQHAFIALPVGWGTPSLFKDHTTGFGVPFTKVASAVAVTNAFSVLIPGGVDVWKSDDEILTAVTVDVS